VALSHAVDQCDVAFILQSSRVQGQLFDNHALRDASIANLQIPSHTAFINISTVNYLLAGLQRLTKDTPQNATWSMLARDLGYRYKRGHQRADMLQLVSSRFVPFGICAGSEHQGGKHETGLAPVQAAVNHITTLTVDGQNRDLVNLWRNIDISAGDQLIFKLEWLPTHSYTLNHYYKGVVRQTFVKPMSCWQLIPDTFRMESPEAPLGLKPWAYDYRINGYWRIGQCFQQLRGRPGQHFSRHVLFAGPALASDICTGVGAVPAAKYRGRRHDSAGALHDGATHESRPPATGACCDRRVLSRARENQSTITLPAICAQPGALHIGRTLESWNTAAHIKAGAPAGNTFRTECAACSRGLANRSKIEAGSRYHEATEPVGHCD